MTPSEREAAKAQERDFWRAVSAPQYDVKISGPIRKATWDEPMDYFAFESKRESEEKP